MSTVQTVTGPIDADQLGLTLAHEHLRGSAENVRAQYPHLYDDAFELQCAVTEVRNAMAHGVRTIIEPSCMDLGRDVQLAQRVVDETGIQLVMATGVYGSHYTFLPHYFENRPVEALVEAFIHDIETGIQGTDVKAAFLKCAVDEPGVTPHVEMIVRACAKASLATGRPIMAHSQPSTRRGLEIMDLLDDEGVDPRKVVIAHTGDTDDLGYIRELLARGPWIGMDRYGLDLFLPTAQRNATVIALCEEGFADRMMLSQDCCATIDWYPHEMRPALAPDWSFTFLFDTVLDQLREGGVTNEQIETMMVANPAAWLTA